MAPIYRWIFKIKFVEQTELLMLLIVALLYRACWWRCSDLDLYSLVFGSNFSRDPSCHD
jgi:hypothetical protein